jgi:cell division protein FtsL
MKLPKLPIGPALGIIVVIYLSFILVGAVRRNYGLQTQINTLQSSITALQSKNQELQYEVAYYATPEFQEKEARAKLGLQAPGEGVIILPKQKAAPVETDAQKKAKQQSNWQQWWSFLFG